MIIIPSAHTTRLEDKLRGFRKCAETVSKLTKTNKEKVEQLEELKSNSIKARNRLDVLYYDIQTLEEENIRLNEKIQSYLDRQNHAELRFITRNDTAKKQLETFRKELTTLAEVLGLDSNRINLTGNRLEITLPESQQTTLSFEETEGNLELVSMSPMHPKFETIKKHLEKTRDLFR